MTQTLEGRIVEVDGDKVTVYAIANPRSFYSTIYIYQNQDTRALDLLFGLTGRPVETYSQIQNDRQIIHDLDLATGASSLGDSEVERVMRYFAILAAQAGNFVGVGEDQVRNHIRQGRVHGFTEQNIDRTLQYKDQMNHGATYLKRITVEGQPVLFPANLSKLLF